LLLGRGGRQRGERSAVHTVGQQPRVVRAEALDHLVDKDAHGRVKHRDGRVDPDVKGRVARRATNTYKWVNVQIKGKKKKKERELPREVAAWKQNRVCLTDDTRVLHLECDRWEDKLVLDVCDRHRACTGREAQARAEFAIFLKKKIKNKK